MVAIAGKELARNLCRCRGQLQVTARIERLDTGFWSHKSIDGAVYRIAVFFIADVVVTR